MRFRLRRFSGGIRRTRYFLRKTPQIIPLVLGALIFFALLFGGYQLLSGSNGLDHSLARTLLRWGLPCAGESEGYDGGRLDLRSLIYLLTDFDLADPLTILEAALPFLPYSPAQLRVFEERPFVFLPELSFAPEPIRPGEQGARPIPAGEGGPAQVLIYHTHSSEMYLGRAVPASRSAEAHYQFRNLADPTVTGVMAAGRHLANALLRLGINTLHETRVHTLPNINYSYTNSEKTVREILLKQKDLQIVIDLHRDAGISQAATTINDRQVARIALVVGTAEQIPLAHPNFQANLSFARKLKSVCDEMYPGLMRPLQVQKDARYNQHLHPGSVIVELGSVENTLEEALLAAELLANVLARLL